MRAPRWTVDLAIPSVALVGLGGAIALAVASTKQGARAVSRRLVTRGVLGLHHVFRVINRALITHGPGTHELRALYFFGLAALSLAWLLLARLIWDRRLSVSTAAIRWTGWLWIVPLLFAVPIGSRDVWAYAAQGDLYLRGHNPYSVGPIVLHNLFSAQVDPAWLRTPSPYGPVWLVISRLAVSVAGSPVPTVYILKAVAAIGLVAISLCLPRLATAVGGSSRMATWLFCCNPLVLVIALGGGHNDLVMMGFVAVGVWLAVGPGPAWLSLGLGSAVVALAVEVKAPALVASAFLPLLWLRYAPSAEQWRSRARSRWVAVCAPTGAVAVVTVAVAGLAQAISGLGLGWIGRLNTAASGAAWLSVPLVLNNLRAYLRGAVSEPSVAIAQVPPTIALIALVLAAIVLPTLWLLGLYRNPMWWLGAAFLAALCLATTVQPWYLIWPLFALVTATRSARVILLVAGLTAAFAIGVEPYGAPGSLQDRPVIVTLGALMVGAAWLIARLGVQPHSGPAHDGRASCGAVPADAAPSGSYRASSPTRESSA